MNEDMRYLTFALGKGRLANKTLELLEHPDLLQGRILALILHLQK